MFKSVAWRTPSATISHVHVNDVKLELQLTNVENHFVDTRRHQHVWLCRGTLAVRYRKICPIRRSDTEESETW